MVGTGDTESAVLLGPKGLVNPAPDNGSARYCMTFETLLYRVKGRCTQREVLRGRLRARLK